MNKLNDMCGSIGDYLKSYWISSTPETNYISLDEDIKVDVAIVGGGIVGITAGYLLSKQGAKVAILEASKIVQGATGFTTAKVTSQHNLIYDKIINSMGMECAKQYAYANESSIEFIENLVKKLNIDCGFERLPAYVYTRKQEYAEDVRKETEAALKLGLKASYVDKLPINLDI